MNVSMVGLDLAKNVFQAHGADASGGVAFRKRMRRDGGFACFSRRQPQCQVAMEACAGAHYWAREIAKLGHTVCLIPPAYVKPFVKRQKNDAADAEAICEAAQRPTMRFVAVKSEEQQASAVVFRARDLLVRQRTQTINALRGHLAEYGFVVAQGPSHIAKLIERIEDVRTICQRRLDGLSACLWRAFRHWTSEFNNSTSRLPSELGKTTRHGDWRRSLALGR